MAEHFASGNWQVMAGKEQEFVERWTEFLRWTRDTHPGLVGANLIRDEQNTSHFVSFAEWHDAEARDEWRQSLEFSERLGACRALCDDFSGGDFRKLVTI